MKMKNKAEHLAKLQIRSEALGGGAVPDDEMQADFIISTGEKDGYGSLMTDRTLMNYTEDCNNGVPFMLHHGNEMHLQIGQTIGATYDKDLKEVRATVSILRDTESTPENMKVDEYIRRMERGYYNAVSVGFRDAKEICNLCNKEIFDWQRNDPCPHIPKRMYNGVECTYNVDEGRLREVSLVPVGANPNAKLLDTREWDADLLKIKTNGDTSSFGAGDVGRTHDPANILEADGLKWRNQLIDTAIKAGVRAEDDFDEAVWRKRFADNDSDFIIAQTRTWTKLGDSKWGKGGRVTGSEDPVEEPTIWLPESVFQVY